MATHQLFIPASALTPDTTGRAFFEPYSIKATNDLFVPDVLILADPATSQEHGGHVLFNVPQNYVGSPVLIALWTSTATTGNCRMRSRYRAIGGDDSESMDQATYQETVPVTDAAPGAAHRRLQASMALTAGNLAAGDLIELYFTRLDDAGTDTIAAATILFGLFFQYADA